MNILYIAHLNTNIAAGPNWSVPARVVAQSKYDNVMLLNTTNVMMEHWKEVDGFHNIIEFGELHLRNLPEPFSRPDICVFEGSNFLEQVKFATGAKITSEITLGNNISIGANSVVNKSVVNKSYMGDSALIAGAPAKYIKDKEPWYEGKYLWRIE